MKRGGPPHSSAWIDPLLELEGKGTLAVERFVTFRVNQLSTDFERQWTRLIRNRAGVSLSQWRIMAVLREGRATFAQLVKKTGINKALVSRSIHDLELSGHLAIDTTPQDARSITLTLTTTGHKVMKDLMPFALGRQRSLLAALSPSERHTLDVAIDKLRRAASEWDGSA